jgi:2',3'-cyclic-nucleotide 2'-phosphodiesterase (5'-nucleotidase family)
MSFYHWAVSRKWRTALIIYLNSSYLIREIRGIRLAILGLTTPSPYPAGHALHRPQAEEVPVEDAVEAARQWVPQLCQHAELVVVLSHLGLRHDIRLALEVPGIHLIIGGHSHHRLPSALRIGTTHIAQAGGGGIYLGVIDVEARGGGF